MDKKFSFSIGDEVVVKDGIPDKGLLKPVEIGDKNGVFQYKNTDTMVTIYYNEETKLAIGAILFSPH